MNVFLRCASLLSLVLLTAAVPLLGQGALIIPVQLFQNGEYEENVTSSPWAANYHTHPQHGTLTLSAATNFVQTVRYVPDEDFVGTDTFQITRFSNPGIPSRRRYIVEVLPAAVTARHDYVTTMEGQAVTIPVLDNDISSNGTLLLAAVPAVNNGTVDFVPGTGASTLSFTPREGFKGLAHFNYVVCNGAGACDNGTVSINVLPNMDMSGTSEVLHIFTKREQPQVVLTPSSYTLISGPSHGVYDDSEDTPYYIPGAGFVGMDYMTFEYNGAFVDVHVMVMDLLENTFAIEDRAYTVKGESVEFNVLHNDVEGMSRGCLSYTQPQNGGIITYPNDNGHVTYTPAPGFQGVDEFSYTAYPNSNCTGTPETAKVVIFVSSFEPEATTFRMSTPKQTPLVIGYNVPITSFSFSIVSQGEHGTVTFLQGSVDTLIYDRQITGYNLLLYIPNASVDQETEDQFEVNYCTLTAAGACDAPKAVKVEMTILDIGAGEGPLCFDDCVWPGDTNFDGKVDMKDLLPIGLCMGEVGQPREESSSQYWYGRYSNNWNDIFGTNSTINLKHLDSDGDSIVTALDTMAISQYYGNTHSLVAAVQPYYNNEIILEGDIFIGPGDLVELDMLLGTPDNVAVDVYGFTMPFAYNPLFFVPESVSFDFSENSWLSYNSPVLHMSHNNRTEGQLEAGYTRTSGISASGYGRIGKVRFTIQDDIAGFRPDGEEMRITVGGGQATGMDSGGRNAAMKVNEIELRLRLRPEHGTASQLSASDLKLYPNPTNQWLNVHLNGGIEFTEVVVYNLMGKSVLVMGGMQARRTQLDVSQLPTGLYFLSAKTPQGVVTQKFEVLK